MINFGISLLIGLGIYTLIFFLATFIKKLITKKPFKEVFLDLDNIFRFASFLVLYIIFLIVIYAIYARTTYFSIITLALSTSLAFVFVPFISIFNKLKNKEFKEINYCKVVSHFGIILLLILEVGVFSNVASKSDNEIIDIPFTSSLIVQTDGQVEEDRIVMDKQRRYIIFDNKNHDFKSIYLDLSSEVETRLQVDVFVSNNNSKYDYKKSYVFNPNYDEFEYFSLDEYREFDYLKIVFVIDEINLHDSSQISPIYLHKIAVNKGFPFIFNILRFGILVSILLVTIAVIKKGRELKFREMDKVALIEKIIFMLCGAGILYVLINSLVCFGTHFVPIDEVNGNSYSIYHQLFDAFRKGQLYLDVEPSEALLNLENPYDPALRKGVSYLWDHAFYNGKYYCYYGPAPVILVMFPLYFISGMKYVPSNLLIEEIGTLFSFFVFILAALQAVKVFVKKVNIPSLVLILIGAAFSSLLLSNSIYKVGYYSEGIYRIPYSYGLCFLFLAYYLFLKAYANQKRRIIYLGFVGLSIVLMMASRPTLLIAITLLIPLFIKMFLEKYPWKNKILDYVPMVGVLFVGAIILCLYNYKRFGSITEFGSSYQLTLTDCTQLKLDVKGLLPTFTNYYLLTPKFTDVMFPFIKYGQYDMVDRYHSYNAGGIGLLCFPMFWSLFALPFIFNKDDDLYQRIMYYMSPFVTFFLAFFIYCFGGVCPRYVVELTAVTSFFSVVPLITLFNKVSTYKPIPSLFVLLLIVSVSSFLSINLLFDGFDGWHEGDLHGIVEVFRSLFNRFNINPKA